MDDGFWKLVKQTFKVTRAKPTNHHEVKQLFVSIVKAANTKDIIAGKQLITKKDRGATAYTSNEGLIKHHLELSGFKNKSCKGFSQEVIDIFGLTPMGAREKATFEDHFWMLSMPEKKCLIDKWFLCLFSLSRLWGCRFVVFSGGALQILHGSLAM